MYFFVFSCATKSIDAGNSILLPAWSKCVCVLMIVVIGLFVSDWTFSRITFPQPGNLVSTITTPRSWMKIPVFPPENVFWSRGSPPPIT